MTRSRCCGSALIVLKQSLLPRAMACETVLPKPSPQLLAISILLCVWGCTAITVQPATSTSGHVCCLTPQWSSGPCPPPCNGSCHNLTNFITSGNGQCDNISSSECLSSGSTVVFLPGIHQVELNASLCVSNVNGLTLTSILPNGSTIPPTSEEIPTIECLGSFGIGFLFSDSTDVRIENLKFVGCGQELPGPRPGYNRTTFGFRDVSNLVMSRVSVLNSSGYGLFALNVMGDSSINSSTFGRNSGGLTWRGGNANFFYKSCPAMNYTSTLSIHNSEFLYGYDQYPNPIATGLSVQLECTDVNVDIDHVTLTGNIANISCIRTGGHLCISTGGNLCILLRSWKLLTDNKVTVRNSLISEGYAFQGGGMYINVLERPSRDVLPVFKSFPQTIDIFNTTFEDNEAKLSGGGLYIIFHEELKVRSQTCSINITQCKFNRNRLWPMHDTGIAVHVQNKFVPGFVPHEVAQFSLVLNNCTFSRSTLSVEGEQDAHSKVLDGGSGAVFILHNPSGVTIKNCSFENNMCPGIAALHSNIIFVGNTTFRNNTGRDGGGLVLCDQSYMYLKPYTSITFINNTALRRGGAIFAQDQCLESQPTCFFQPDVELIMKYSSLNDTVHVTMEGNRANFAGSSLYGGLVDYCNLLSIGPHSLWLSHKIQSHQFFDRVFTDHSGSPTDLSFISSDPIGVCLCNDTGQYNGTCANKTANVSAFPGETFSLAAIIVGQKDGTVPGGVVAKIEHEGTHVLGHNEHIQAVDSTSQCTRLGYTILPTTNHGFSRQVTVILLAQETVFDIDLGSGTQYFFSPPEIHVILKPCPLGFTLTKSEFHTCDCIDILKKCGVTCSITQKIIRRPKDMWIGFSEHTGERDFANTTAVVFQTHCPFDFCKPRTVHIQVYENDTLAQDKQCASNRAGILCGACKPGLSLVLGSNRCFPCSNVNLAVLLIMLFGLAGLALVVLLIVCNFTVTEGTINGFIFYANIVQANFSIFFPPVPANANSLVKALASIFTVFIAWLNLNLGVEVCFYDGLDAYAKTWFQFAFPIYLWALAVTIIYLCRKSAVVGRLMGTNAVKVLATLFLLSYAKLLSTVILAIQSTVLTYVVDGTVFHETVWLFDGNQRYTHGKHIILFCTAVVFGLATLPYTFTLLCLRRLQRNSERKMFSWVNKLKPFLDAYAGPYTDRYRGWIGITLFIRLLLFVAFALNIIGEASLDLLVTSAMVFCSLAFIRGAYKWWVLDILEGSLILNLGLLSAATAYVLKSGGNQAAVTYTSVGTALLTFIAVLVYHAFRKIPQRTTLCQQHPHMAREASPEPIAASDSTGPIADNDSQQQLLDTATASGGRMHHSQRTSNVEASISRNYIYANHRSYQTFREPLLETTDCAQ